jgi:hypothetical protein
MRIYQLVEFVDIILEALDWAPMNRQIVVRMM